MHERSSVYVSVHYRNSDRCLAFHQPREGDGHQIQAQLPLRLCKQYFREAYSVCMNRVRFAFNTAGGRALRLLGNFGLNEHWRLHVRHIHLTIFPFGELTMNPYVREWATNLQHISNLPHLKSVGLTFSNNDYPAANLQDLRLDTDIMGSDSWQATGLPSIICAFHLCGHENITINVHLEHKERSPSSEIFEEVVRRALLRLPPTTQRN